MCPRTSLSFSSFTLNIVLGRASRTSPSISIFSSLPMRRETVAAGTNRAGRLLALECCLAGPVLEERSHGPLQILRVKERPGDLGSDLIRPIHATLEVPPHDGLRRRMRNRRPLGKAASKPHPLVHELVVPYDP